MAGHRRGTGRPTQRRTRADRARIALAERMAAATSPVERVYAAAEYARSAITFGMRTDPASTEHTAAQIAHYLTTTAERVFAAGVRADRKEARS